MGVHLGLAVTAVLAVVVDGAARGRVRSRAVVLLDLVMVATVVTVGLADPVGPVRAVMVDPVSPYSVSRGL